jgi:hypothetical protein
MFIHFGLYSHLGGVWDGQPVRQGYSEQIQSFAGIFSDWYAETAYEFNPVNFDADEIALLAKKAGMWKLLKQTDKKVYKRLRYSVFGIFSHLPGAAGRKFLIWVYRQTQKVYGFN